MKFTHISLENWRNFQQGSAQLQDRMFIIGPNAAGKSNFLDAFRFLRDLVLPGGGFEKAIADRGGVSSLRCLAARQSPAIVLDVTLSDNDPASSWRYRLAFSQNNRRRPEIQAEQVWHNNSPLLNRPDAQDEQDGERLHQTYLEQTFANLKFRDIASFFASVHYYHLIPQLVREPERYTKPQADPFGGDFLARIAETQAQTQKARLRHIQKALQIAVPQLGELRLSKDEQGIPHLEGKYEHWRPQGAWQNEADFSDGTLRLLGLLWAILDGIGPLLLEEPELSLHPEIVAHIPQLMHRVQQSRRKKKRQIFLSTHSSDLLQDEGIAPDEILLVLPKQEGSILEVGVNNAEIRRLLEAGLSPAEAALPFTRPKDVNQLALF